MPELTAKDYMESGDRCVQEGLYDAAIVAYSKAVQNGEDDGRAKEALQNAYKQYDIPGLRLIGREDYVKQYPEQAKKLELPGNVAYILKGTEELSKLPAFPKQAGESHISHVDFELSRKYPVINDESFAIDFSECSNLEDIPSTFFSMSGKLICADLSGCDKLSKINGSSFALCTSLESVIFPKNLRMIGDLAFQGTALKKLDLSGTKVVSIGRAAFNYNKTLIEATLSDDLKEIGEEAFSDCYNLKELKNLTGNLEEFPRDSIKNTAVEELNVLEGFRYFPFFDIKVKYSKMGQLRNDVTGGLLNYFFNDCERDGLCSGHLYDSYLKLNEILKLNPNHEQALLECGYACLKLHKQEEAKERFTRLIELQCTDNEINYNAYIGRARANMIFEGKENEIINDLSRAIEIVTADMRIDQKERMIIDSLECERHNRSYAECYMQRSRMYEKLGNKEAAEKDYRKAIEIDGTYEFPRFELIKAEDYHGAMELPEDTKYVLKGSRDLKVLPRFGRICTVAGNLKRLACSDNGNGYFPILNVEEMYPELLNNKFALDFSNCRQLRRLQGGAFAGLKNIVAADFSGCDSLREMPGYCFENCSNLETIILNRHLHEIGSGVFAGCGLKKLDLSGTALGKIGHYSFERNESLKEVILPECLNKFHHGCFKDCTSLCKISQLPRIVDFIEREAFANTALKEIETKGKDHNSRFPDIGVKLKYILTNADEFFLDGKERLDVFYNYRDSVEYFNKSLECNENYLQARFYRGYALLQGFEDAEHLDLAVNDLTKVLDRQIDKDTEEKAHLWRALALIKKDELYGTDNRDLIKSDLDQSIRVNFACNTYGILYKYNYMPMAKAYCRCGDYDSAKYVLENALKNKDCAYDFDMRTEFGIINFMRNDYRAAVESLDKAEELKGRIWPSNKRSLVDLYYYRGKAKSALGNQEEALHDYEKAAGQPMNKDLEGAVSDAINETKQKIENKRERTNFDGLEFKRSKSSSRPNGEKKQNENTKTKSIG